MPRFSTLERILWDFRLKNWKRCRTIMTYLERLAMAESESSRIADLRRTIELLSVTISDIDIEIDAMRAAKKSGSALIDLIKTKSDAQRLREEIERDIQDELVKAGQSSVSSQSSIVVAQTIDGNGTVNIRPAEDRRWQPVKVSITYEKFHEPEGDNPLPPGTLIISANTRAVLFLHRDG